jgi:hypothetical protein
VRVKQRALNGNDMKKKVVKSAQTAATPLRSEYDFSASKRNPYTQRLREPGCTIRIFNEDGTFTEKNVPNSMTVVLEPDVKEYFPNSAEVNRALRTLISLFPEARKSQVSKTS